MVKTKSLAETQKAWEDAIPRVAGRYKTGVEQAENVIENAIAAEDLWAAKMQEAIADKRRAKRLAETSTAEWKIRASGVGAQRIASGMQGSVQKFNKGMAPVLAALQSVTLPDRVADPEANVDNRVKPIVRALSALKRR